MKNDIWKIHDWLIDQKKENKINAQYCDYIIEYINQNYCPNFENIYIQEKFISEVEKIEWPDWKEFTRNKNIYDPINYRCLADILKLHEKISSLKDYFMINNIGFNENEHTCHFGQLYQYENFYVDFTWYTDPYEDFLIIFHDPVDYSFFVYDNNLFYYGFFKEDNEVINLIKKFEKDSLNIKSPENIKDYYRHLKQLYRNVLATKYP